MRVLQPSFFKALPRLRLLRIPVSFLAALLTAVFAGPHMAMAQSVETFGDVMCSVAVNIVPYVDVFNMLAYLAGIYFIIQGTLHLRSHYENPGQNPLHKTVALFLGGSALMLLPTIIGMLIETFFDGGGGGGDLTVCSVTEPGGGGAITPDVMLKNMVDNIKEPLTFLTSAIAILIGIFLIVRGLMRASKYGTDPRTHSITNIVTSFVIGAILVVVGQSVGTILESVFGTGAGISSFSVLNWSNMGGLGSSTGFQQGVEAALTFVQLIGFISFVRGWNIIRHALEGSGQATVPQGITHIVGGVLAINIYAFIQVMDKTFGTNFFT